MEITCTKCGKVATISAKKGNLCYSCWKSARNSSRKIRQSSALDDCLEYVGARKVSAREAKLINDVMMELEKSKVSKSKAIKD